MSAALGRLLLLTATISPHPSTAMLVRADPAVRREDYRRAMTWYARHLSPHHWSIALVENSDSDVQDLIDLAGGGGHNLRVIRSPAAASGAGKGNGEASMLDAAEQDLRSEDLAFRQIVKATGRLIVQNLEDVVPDAGDPHISARMHRDRSMADTRVLAFDQATWGEHLRGMGALVDEAGGRFLEHAVALRTAQAVFAGPTRWLPFAGEPRVAGVSGTDGIRYDSPRSRITRRVKNGLLRLPQADYR